MDSYLTQFNIVKIRFEQHQVTKGIWLRNNTNLYDNFLFDGYVLQRGVTVVRWGVVPL